MKEGNHEENNIPKQDKKIHANEENISEHVDKGKQKKTRKGRET